MRFRGPQGLRDRYREGHPGYNGTGSLASADMVITNRHVAKAMALLASSQHVSATVKFSRPTEEGLFVIINLTAERASWPSDGVQHVKDKIVAYGLELEHRKGRGCLRIGAADVRPCRCARRHSADRVLQPACFVADAADQSPRAGCVRQLVCITVNVFVAEPVGGYRA
jgi:hypothetical protein